MRQVHNKRVIGFTLIEILVVLFIISIVTSVALLTIGRHESRELSTVTDELTQLMSLASEQAMLQSTVMGLSLSKHAYQFVQLQSSQDEKKTTWLPLDDTVFNHHRVPDDVEIQIKTSEAIAHQTKNAQPQIIISVNGDITPFTIYVAKKGKKPRYVIEGRADGEVSSHALS